MLQNMPRFATKDPVNLVSARQCCINRWGTEQQWWHFYIDHRLFESTAPSRGSKHPI